VNPIRICQRDHSHLFLRAEPSIEQELSEEFSFFVPNYKFMPAYRNKMWDGKLRLFNRQTKSFPAGLIEELRSFADSRGYTVEIEEELPSPDEVAPRFDFPLTSKGNPIEIRDYQRESVKHLVSQRRGILLSPTGSGKSLMIYLLARIFDHKRCLIVVPTTNLVEQMVSDFADYSETDDSFDASSKIHKIYAGQDKDYGEKEIVITTWQSIHKFPKSWFQPFEMIIGDEAHTFKAKSLTSILDKCVNADVRVGTTGTLDGTEVHEMVLKGLFGPVYRATSTKDLIDSETLSDTKIDLLLLRYDEPTIKKFRKEVKTYPDEIDWLVSNTKRNKFLIRLAFSLKSNTLLLFNYVEKHGKPLFDLAQSLNPDDRPIYFISGEIDASERESIRQTMEGHSNALLIASLGTFSTGINIRNLHNIIFASPTKSQIRVLQSIGRGLRKHGNHSSLKVFDVIDDLSGKRSTKNYSLQHGIKRASIYAKEQFEFQQHSIPFRHK
jgi:superfamily II DNA or RNA helicase